MSRTQGEIFHDEKRSLEFGYITTALSALWKQDYEPCLELLKDKPIELTTTFTIQKTGAKWYFECNGDHAWNINFVVIDNVVSDVYIGIAYCKRKELLRQLEELVLYILSTYHPDGRKLFTY